MSPKAKRRLLLTAIVLLVLIGLIWWSRSGPSELDRYKAQLLAQGEILDLDQLAPIRTGNEPDGDLPLQSAVRQFTNSLVLQVGQCFPTRQTNNLLRVEWLNHPKATNQTQRAALWTQAEAEIENRRADFQLLHTAMQNPPAEKGADFRKFYSGYPNGNYVQRRTVAQLLSQAVTVDAHARRRGEAATNMLTLLDMCEHLREEWSLVNQMIRVAITGLSLETFHYGLDTHTWDEPQLAHFQTRFESLSLLTNLHQTLLYERALHVQMFSNLRHSIHPNTNVVRSPASMMQDKVMTLLWDMDEDEYTLLKVSQDRLDLYRRGLATSNWAGVPAQFRAISDAAHQDPPSWRNGYKRWMSSIMINQLEKALQTLFKAENTRLQTTTAIAIERHRLKHGHYPNALADLIPDYLSQIPHDPMDGRPMRYRLNTDGSFTLWSVGFDGKDDGGDPTMPDPKKQSFPQDARDLLWPRLDPIDLPPKQ